MAKYKIQDFELVMSPLKIRQIRELLKVVSSLDIGEKKSLEEVKAEELIDLLLSDKVKEVAQILFGDDSQKVNWDEVEYETVEEIVKDFLSLNPGLVERLKSLFGFSGSMKLPVAPIRSSKSMAKK